METPSSTRRMITRSQDLASANNNNNTIPMSRKFEETEKGMSKSRQRTGKQQQERSALIDITNDSPIVGLAKGNLDTPSSKFSRKMFTISSKHMTTPGSGEALLRGQVKTLLQKVEEEAVVSKIPVEYRQFLNHHGIVCSPMALLAPTPANTPQVSDLSGNGGSLNNVLASVAASPVEVQFKFSQMINEIIEGRRQDSAESEKSMITRSLLFDFSEKTEDSVSSDDCTSVLTYQEECISEGSKETKSSSADDDDSSVWSIQVNASTRDEEEAVEQGDGEDFDLDYVEEGEEEEYYEDDGDYYKETDEEQGDGDLLVDELCEGMSKISMNGAEFTGKHTRFVYNSDDEFEGQVGEGTDETSATGVLRLKGLPTPKGKHLRFHDDEEEA